MSNCPLRISKEAKASLTDDVLKNPIFLPFLVGRDEAVNLRKILFQRFKKRGSKRRQKFNKLDGWYRITWNFTRATALSGEKERRRR